MSKGLYLNSGSGEVVHRIEEERAERGTKSEAGDASLGNTARYGRFASRFTATRV
jgi:hypothetical protein